MLHSRLTRAAAAAAWSASVLTAQPAGAARDSQAHISALVTVVSGSGAPIVDLTPADFVVREKRDTHEVVRVDALNAVPLYLSILLDVSKPPLGTIPPVSDMRAAMSSFIKAIRAANPGAQIALTEVAGAAVPVVAFDAPAADLDAAIARLNVGQQVDAVMIEGLLDAARTLADKPTIRKAVLLIDFGSSDPTRTATTNTALQEIQETVAAVWSVSVRPANAPSSRREPALKAAVESTGGLRLTAVSATGLTSMLQQTAANLSSQYLVTFARAAGTPLRVDDVTVESKKGKKVLVHSVLR